jgi:hypothetical protein
MRDGGGLALRVFNTSTVPGSVMVELDGAPARGWRVDLLGRPLEPFEASTPLRPWEIATLRLD